MLSIVIPTYNEAKWLPRSMQAICDVLPESPHELIIIDDCSTDKTREILLGFADRYPTFLPILKETRGGVSNCRRMGAQLSTGDTICFIDAHVWPTPGFFESLEASVNEHPDSIITPGLTQHRLTDPWTPLPDLPVRGTNYGGGFTFAASKWRWYMSVNKHPVHYQRRNGSYACGMTMKKAVYDYLNGWANLPGYWSYSDATMCMKAWFADVPILVDTKAHHFHGIKGFGPHSTPKWHEVINRVYSSRILFDDSIYENFWCAGLKERYGRHWAEDWKDILNSPGIRGERAHMVSISKFSSMEFLQKFVFPRLDSAKMSRTPYGEY